MSQPDVSVIIPFYKVAPFIGRCTTALMEQTASDVEFIFSYYYFGFLCGDKNTISSNHVKLASYLLPIVVLLQIGEGWLWWKVGWGDCGTPMKLTALITNLLFMVIICPYLGQQESDTPPLLPALGTYAFGIYLIHPLFIRVFAGIPFCLNTLAVLLCSFMATWILHYMLKDRISRWLGLI